jgi:hypothetical protein
MAGSDTTLWYDIIAHNQGSFNPSSARMLFDNITIRDGEYGIYFVYGFAAPVIWNCEITRCQLDAFAFIDANTKTFVNSNVNVFNMSGYWASPIYDNRKTIDILCTTEAGIPIEGVSIKFWDKDGTLVIDEVTDSAGVITQQLLLVQRNDMVTGIATDYNPFKVVVTKEGWKDKDFEIEITEEKVIEFVMENPGLSEDEN